MANEVYEVLARKYRPQRFADVVGQQHVSQTLRNAILKERVANAYLFVGPRGVGKTSIARIMAKALNCPNKKSADAEPCDQCDSCREIRESSSLDVIEFDAASNTQVEKVRELIIDSVKFRPARGPYKIYIVDEVHMLSNSSFNALLKTLEEPPKDKDGRVYCCFIFATTDPQKVPVTILSRCQRFDLRRIATNDIVGHLGTIAEKEGVKIGPDALLAIARGAEGGLRDAESALDQLIAFRGREIGEEDVLSVFGLVSRKSLETLSEAMLSGDVPAVLQQVADIESAGKDLARLALELLDYFRNLLVLAHSGGRVADPDIADAQLEVLKRQAAQVDPSRLLKMVDQLIDLQGTLRYALSRRTSIEVALIRAARASQVAGLDEILRAVRELQASDSGGGEPAPSSQPAPSTAAHHVPAPRSASVAAIPAGDEVAMLASRWHEVIERVGTVAALAKGPMRDVKPVQVTPERVVIGLDPEFASNRDLLMQPRQMAALQSAFKHFLGRAVSVEVRVLPAGSGPVPADHPVTAAPAPAPAPAATPPPAKPAAHSPRSNREKWEGKPEVKRTLEAFNGGIVDIRE